MPEKLKAQRRLAPVSLLGCPWCGERPEYQRAAKDPNNPPYGWPETLLHDCKVIGIQICIRYDNFGPPYDESKDIFAAWNTRKQPNHD